MDAPSRQANTISGDTAKSIDQDRIDRVLRSKRVYQGPACISRSAWASPIGARDGDAPNEDEPAASPRICASPGGSGAVNRSAEEALTAASPIASNDVTGEQPYSGGTSVLAQLHLLDPDSFRDIAEDAVPILGLQNTFVIDPFLDTTTPQARWTALQNILPDKSEVLTGQLRDPDKTSEQWFSNKSTAYIALLLATLTSGSHFSLPQTSESSERCLQLVRRTFKALQLANYLFRPSLDIIQALLILGNALQNFGQSDGAWVLLETTVRLAQALGLHMEAARQKPGEVGRKVRAVWTPESHSYLTTETQGRHGVAGRSFEPLSRSPCRRRSHWLSPASQDTELSSALTYVDIMHNLQRVLVGVMSKEVVPDLALATRLVRDITVTAIVVANPILGISLDSHARMSPHADSQRIRRERIVVAMTGATGSSIGIKLLLTLRRLHVETHLIMSKWAEETLKYETDYHPSNVKALGDHVYSIHDMAAAVSSGSFQNDGMVVVPCSMKTLTAISSGFGDDLIS
ncbi:phenylacrylic acid decarboxylase [Trichoderma arundinaceum]|uniref:Phenylacrylic acid decarboxylase n=1 Tax=Trichoderma arundinaceum TaxID=490622 RepID=A0A395NY85_TRIAR|nr:phenylacrylic acid decarboxylase [Trichoderma arundinaceum]